jgi:hypothetical protein
VILYFFNQGYINSRLNQSLELRMIDKHDIGFLEEEGFLLCINLARRRQEALESSDLM